MAKLHDLKMLSMAKMANFHFQNFIIGQTMVHCMTNDEIFKILLLVHCMTNNKILIMKIGHFSH